tara:strand:- start:608 stop:835 length:228 start_codon:yes stop_codon:yes gene_type:complete
MKIIKCTHVTSTEKKHLKAFLESGFVDAKINSKYYKIISSTEDKGKVICKIKISTPYFNSLGVKKYENQNIEVLN